MILLHGSKNDYREMLWSATYSRNLNFAIGLGVIKWESLATIIQIPFTSKAKIKTRH
jgi:hypothetical protein